MLRTHLDSLRAASAAALTGLVLVHGSAVGQEADGVAKGVNPKDNITKFDLIAKRDVLQDGVRVSSLSFKYDRALDAAWGVNVELPLVKFDSPAYADSGLGDIQLRARYVTTEGAVSYLGALELVTPTASSDVLGLGRWQLNPVVGAVFALSPYVFVFAGYKHLFSVPTSSQRADINASQPRALAAYTSPQGWWLLADFKYTRDWEADQHALDSEFEAGTMLSASSAASLRLGTSSLDSARASTLTLNLRFIF